MDSQPNSPAPPSTMASNSLCKTVEQLSVCVCGCGGLMVPFHVCEGSLLLRTHVFLATFATLFQCALSSSSVPFRTRSTLDRRHFSHFSHFTHQVFQLLINFLSTFSQCVSVQTIRIMNSFVSQVLRRDAGPIGLSKVIGCSPTL